MRLTVSEQQVILGAIRAREPRAEVYLFGSRVDDAARGGDVDLYIETPTRVGVWRKAQLLAELEKRLGLSVDLVLHTMDEPEKPLHRIAKLTGVALS